MWYHWPAVGERSKLKVVGFEVILFAQVCGTVHEFVAQVAELFGVIWWSVVWFWSPVEPFWFCVADKW